MAERSWGDQVADFLKACAGRIWLSFFGRGDPEKLPEVLKTSTPAPPPPETDAIVPPAFGAAPAPDHGPRESAASSRGFWSGAGGGIVAAFVIAAATIFVALVD